MIYNYMSPTEIGKPVVVLDASGNQYSLHCTRVDTETGLIVYLDLESKLEGKTEEVCIFYTYKRPPLKVLPVAIWNRVEWIQAEDWFLPTHPTRWLQPYRTVAN